MKDISKKESISGQYLTFTLAEELYGVDIAQVSEVMDYMPITSIPGTPDFLLGIINLRGKALPVVDMRLKFNLENTERTVNTCIIITEVIIENEKAIMGALADSVQEVFEIHSKDIEPPPKMGATINTEFIQGMARHDDKFIIIIDVNRVFSMEELSIVQEAGES